MPDRRAFLKTALFAGLGTAATACERSRVSWLFGRATPTAMAATAPLGTFAERNARRILGRAAWGARPVDLTRVAAIGVDAFVEEQLSPAALDDTQATLLVRRIELLRLAPPDVVLFSGDEAMEALRRATILRALYSERQLLERMVEFWSDHFNVAVSKGECAWLKAVDEASVLRPHALGNFRDLLRGSLTSPAMLVSLDGRANLKGKPNENHARELLELHTLGVTGGYTQRDVMELARVLTGWRVRLDPVRRGTLDFQPAGHDPDSKTVLAARFSAGAEGDLDHLVALLSSHPSTARFLAEKLCRRFVADDPPADLVARVARAFAQSGGDIRATLSALFHAPEILAAPPLFKRPLGFALSSLRALGAVSDGAAPLQDELRRMGQLPYDWPTPDGYPDGEAHWRGSLLPRWAFAVRLLDGKLRGTRVSLGEVPAPALAASLLGRPLAAFEEKAIASLSGGALGVAAALCHPEVQYS